MKKQKILILLLVVVFVFGIVTTNLRIFSLIANASTAEVLVTQINTVNGLSATVAGNVVTVNNDGPAHRTANLHLNIDSDVTVIWNAALTGNATANNY